MICEYGCGREAKYQLKNGKWSCSVSQNSCPERIRACSEGMKLRIYSGVKIPTCDRKVRCKYCFKEISVLNIGKHEPKCPMNPDNIRTCPRCGSIVNHISNRKCDKCIDDIIPNTQFIRKCFDYHGKKCIICGEENIVAVHHFDSNHQNNDINNLIPLCPTHHTYCHSKYYRLIKDRVEQYHFSRR